MPVATLARVEFAVVRQRPDENPSIAIAVASSLSWPTRSLVGVSPPVSRRLHPTGVEGAREVKNLDFTPEGSRATLAS